MTTPKAPKKGDGKSLLKLWEADKHTKVNIEKELGKIINNLNVIDSSNHSVLSLNKVNVQTIDFTHLDELIVSDNEQYYYKQYRVLLYQGLASELDNIVNLILPNLNYAVIFEEAEETTLDFYNTGQELKTMAYYELKDTDIYLNISVYISKAFGGAEIINPRVKLEISWRNFVKVKQ